MAAIAKSGSALQLTCWMMLLALLAASWQSTAHASRFHAAFQQSRRLDSAPNSERPRVIRAELIHRDHPLSPLAPPEGTSLADRWAAALERASNRIASRGRRLEDFQTPITKVSEEFVMTISFGTPPQRFTGLVDTGSDLVWIQCVKCTDNCFNFPQADPLYNPELSSSEYNISCTDPACTNFPFPHGCTLDSTCGISYGYGDGSTIHGSLLTESITLLNTAGANPAAPGFIMGCMNNNTGLFDGYDGIVGFGRGSYSFPSQMNKLAYLPVFSYCLVPFAAATTNTSTMLFGASDPANALGLVYTPILYDSAVGHYYVNMTGISVNGVAVNSISGSVFERNSTDDTGGVIFDSGTTLTYFFPQVYDALQQAVASSITYPVVENPGSYCLNITGVTTPVYPNVTFHFVGVDGTSVVDYNLADLNLFSDADSTGVSCLQVGTRDDTIIIGNVAMGNHYIETDETVNMRIGWVTKDCTV